jgi:DNA polymerase III alpha subunit/nucleotidyltransferase/DNA polymerase involved in DNA repair
MSRVIVHLDADAFFASVEQAADPRLRGKAVAVGGEKRGIIASASYEARKFGVYTPMPTVRARKLCPKLIVLPGDFEKYEHFSRWMFSYAQDFTPDVEIASIDEGYFDLSAVPRPPLDVAEAIRTAIRQSLKISVSEGIASNKLVSQIASKLNKPAAFRRVPAGTERAFLHPLPNQWLPGVGPHTAQRLNAAGLALILHVAATPTDLLHLLVGRAAPQLKAYADGLDDRPVVPLNAPAKSYSQQRTFEADLTDEDYAEAVLRRMADELMAKVRADGQCIRTLTVKVRYNDMAEDQCGESLLEPTDLETDLYGRIHQLFRQAWKRRVSLRLVSLKLSNLYDGLFRVELPLERSAQQQDARRRLAAAVDGLRQARGARVVLRGHDFCLRAGPAEALGGAISGTRQGNHEIHERRAEGSYRPVRSAEWNSALPIRRSNTCELSGRKQTKPVTGYVPLLVRSYYSFLNSTLSMDAIVALAKRHGLPAVALADEGNLHGAVEFTQAARRAGLKPILGVTVSLEGRPLNMYVENATGYHNLCCLLSAAARAPRLRGPGEPPEGGTLAWSLSRLEGLTDGLLAVSADPRLAALFGDRFYFAVSAPEAVETARAGGWRPVAMLPVHYADRTDRWKWDIVQSIRTRTLLRQEHPAKQLAGDFHFRPPAEMTALFGQHPEGLAHTVEIGERCSFEMPLGEPQFPAFVPPDGTTSRAFLRRLVREGLQRRYPQAQIADRQSQIEQELAIIAEVGYEEYFLVVWDLLQECRRRGIGWITRGSAADSLVCYCLGISDVCPIRFDLYFRRFLNKERMKLNKLPDIDVDFPHDRKDDVIDLIFEKYGAEHAAVVGGFSTFQARSAVADVAKVLGVSEFQIRRFTEHFPWTSAGHVREAVLQSQECRDLPVTEEPYRTALEMAACLDGFPRYAKMHPCGVVLSRQPMAELTPTFTSSKGYPTTHFDMDAVEAIGLVKIDILAQGGLAVMRDVRAGLAFSLYCENGERQPSPQPSPVGRERESGTPRGGFSWMVENGVHADSHQMGEGRGEGASLGVKLSTPERGSTARRGAEFHSAVSPSSTRLGVDTFHSQQNLAARLLASAATAADEKTWLAPLEPWDDPAVWEMIAGGGARAVHHIESPAMIGLCRQCNVREIDGLVAIVSVIRPGAANEQKKLKFTRRYQGLEPVAYPHPSLALCLRSTFGLVVYEEHILQICEAFAGLPAGRADVLRRALGKVKQEVIEEIRGEFVACARARGHPAETIVEVWNLVSSFAGYAFCKAHSTAYGVEAYQSAWLKHYYPVEFMAAVLSNGKGFYHPLVYILECHRLGIPLLPPSVNQPGPKFSVMRNQAIRVPLTRLKGLTERTRDRLRAERQQGPFAGLSDFYRRVAPAPEEMESMIRVGAFDEFGKTRTAQFWEARHLDQALGGHTVSGQGWLLPPPDLNRRPAAPLIEPTRRQRLEWETELLDFTASGHPLELYDDIAWNTYCPVARLGEHVGQQVVTCGLVIEQRTHHQVTGEPMKFLTLADWTGMVETELFASTYRSYGLATVRYPVLEVTATVEPFENGRGFSLRVQRAGRPRKRRNGEC